MSGIGLRIAAVIIGCFVLNCGLYACNFNVRRIGEGGGGRAEEVVGCSEFTAKGCI